VVKAGLDFGLAAFEQGLLDPQKLRGLVAMSNSGDTQYKTSENLSARADMFKRFGTGGWHAWVFDHLLAADLPGDATIADIGA
jgi:hypothetical protein